MIRKILCPTDFSVASSNAIEYAAKLAQQTGSTLTLLNVQPIYIGEGVSMFSGGERESVVEAKASSDKMNDYCNELNRIFKVSATFEIIPTMGSFEKIVADESTSFDLVIIGTNGADNMYQFVFGSHSFGIAKKTTIPVLVIPEKYFFKGIQHVIFASDYNKGEGMLLKQLNDFMEIFNPQLHVIHISDKDTPVSREVYHSFCNMTKEALNESNNVSFERIVSENAIEVIDNYLLQKQSDIITLYFEKHGFLYRLFHTDLIKHLTSAKIFPVLLFHN